MAASPGVDGLLAAAGLDPALGVQLVAGGRLASVAFDPSLPLVLLCRAGRPADPRPTVLPGRHARAGARDGAPRPLSRRATSSSRCPTGAPRAIESLTDEEIAAGDWLVPALPPLDNLASPHGMAAISARLRAADGCPWDRKQTHASLRPFVLEEAYETVDAIERGAPADLAEELGDLFLQIILHAQLAAEEGAFDLTDVYRTLGAKIVRRHPHVFGDVEVSGAEEVLRNWEAIKAAERHEAGEPAVRLQRRRPRPSRPCRQPRDPGARLVPRLGLAGDRGRLGEGRRGARRAARGGLDRGRRRARRAPPRARRRPLRGGQPGALDEARSRGGAAHARTAAGSIATSASRRSPPPAAWSWPTCRPRPRTCSGTRSRRRDPAGR